MAPMALPKTHIHMQYMDATMRGTSWRCAHEPAGGCRLGHRLYHATNRALTRPNMPLSSDKGLDVVKSVGWVEGTSNLASFGTPLANYFLEPSFDVSSPAEAPAASNGFRCRVVGPNPDLQLPT